MYLNKNMLVKISIFNYASAINLLGEDFLPGKSLKAEIEIVVKYVPVIFESKSQVTFIPKERDRQNLASILLIIELPFIAFLTSVVLVKLDKNMYTIWDKQGNEWNCNWYVPSLAASVHIDGYKDVAIYPIVILQFKRKNCLPFIADNYKNSSVTWHSHFFWSCAGYVWLGMTGV